MCVNSLKRISGTSQEPIVMQKGQIKSTDRMHTSRGAKQSSRLSLEARENNKVASRHLVESQLVNLRKNQSKLEQNQTANKGLPYFPPPLTTLYVSPHLLFLLLAWLPTPFFLITQPDFLPHSQKKNAWIYN